MLGTRRGLRVLGPSDLQEVQRLLAEDPVTHVFVDHRVRLTRLEPRWLGGEVWGYEDGNGLVSLCHAAANLVPVRATPAALTAYAARALQQGRKCGSLMGVHEDVMALWQLLEPDWGPARSVRPRQPFMVLDGPPAVPGSPDVRRVRPDEIDALYPACVAMYTEELGVSPEVNGGASLYRARVAQLISKGHAFAHIDDGEVLFKAEIGALTPFACQLQSVWITPRLRGQRLAHTYVASACKLAQEESPVVSLYVNQHNEAARKTYVTVGFSERCRFATILF